MTSATLAPGQKLSAPFRHRLITSGAGRGILIRRYFYVLVLTWLPLLPVVSVPGGEHRTPSAMVAAASFAGSVGLPWLYWLLRCRSCISVACIAGWGSSAILLLEGQLLFGYSSAVRTGVWAFLIGLILLTGLTVSYRRYLRADFGWSSLGAADRSGVLLATGVTAMAAWSWTAVGTDSWIRIGATILGLGIVLAATLNTAGGARYAASRLQAYVAELERRFPPRVAGVLHRVLDPVLRAYSSASVCVLVGGSLVAFVFNLASLDLAKSAGDTACWVGCAFILSVPVIVERCTPGSEHVQRVAIPNTPAAA